MGFKRKSRFDVFSRVPEINMCFQSEPEFLPVSQGKCGPTGGVGRYGCAHRI